MRTLLRWIGNLLIRLLGPTTSGAESCEYLVRVHASHHARNARSDRKAA